MSKLDRIISKGTNITEHYLGESNEQFEIYRYNEEVYAIRYDDKTPVNYISMWKSNKSMIKNIEPHEILGVGMEGIVYQKTKDKAMKTSSRIKNTMVAVENNERILEQKFFLKDNNIQDYFVLGLWNIKDNENYHFYMPKEEIIGIHHSRCKPEKLEDFVMALKVLNDSGYWHGDLSNNHLHHSLQNLIETNKFYKAVDLDAGFGFVQEKYSNNDTYTKMVSKLRDQWIFVYNYESPLIDEHEKKVNWQLIVDNWYNKNVGQSLSDNPDVLIKLCHEGSLSLPQALVYELNEELSRNLGPQKQSRNALKNMSFFSENKQKAYKGIRDNNILRSVILQDLKESLSDISTIEELNEKKSTFLCSEEMKFLSKSKGAVAKIFDIPTNYQKTVNKIFKETEKQIQMNQEEESENTLKFNG